MNDRQSADSAGAPSGLFARIDLQEEQGAPLTKGERTRARLLQATLEMLAEQPYNNVRITDICGRAGISQGTFYIYFKDKVAIAEALMDILLSRLTGHVLSVPRFDDAFASILEANRRYAEFFQYSKQFNLSVSQMLSALPSIKERSMEVNRAVAARIAEGYKRRVPESAGHESFRISVAYAMLGMIDTLYIGYFSGEEGPLAPLFRDADHIVEFASVMWHRAMFGSNPRGCSDKQLFQQLDVQAADGKAAG